MNILPLCQIMLSMFVDQASVRVSYISLIIYTNLYYYSLFRSGVKTNPPFTYLNTDIHLLMNT